MPKMTLFIKLFVWFWLTLLSALAFTLVTSQFVVKNVITERLPPPAVKNIEYIARSIERFEKRSAGKAINEVINLPRLKRHRMLFLAHQDPEKNTQNFTSSSFDATQLSFSYGEKPVAIFADTFHAFGPAKLTYQGETYYLYDVQPERKTPLSLKIKHLPLTYKLGLVFLVSMVLSFVFSRSLVTPLKRIQEAARRLAQGDLSSRVKDVTTRQDELGALSRDFNHMADKLAQQAQSQKRLLADVSHELRSPLTRLQMATGLLQESLDGNAHPHLNRIEQEANTLNTMLSDVLTLSRLENQLHPLDKAPFDLATTLETILSNAQFELEHQGKKLAHNQVPECTLLGDQALIASAIENVLRNAIRYCHNTVSITFTQTANKLKIQICDDGDGVSTEHLSRLSDAFYRVAAARTPMQQHQSIGLGLAIAKHALVQHNGQLEFAHHSPKGLCVTLSLPI